MTRLTLIALAMLLAMPAMAETCPILHLYPEYGMRGECYSARCYGFKLLREAYKRGEITTVHLSKKSECNTLRERDIGTWEMVSVPCTWSHDDDFVGK